MAVTLAVEVGVFVRPCLGEARSGDGAVVVEDARRLLVAIVDVLGHGTEAHEVARRIERLIEERAGDDGDLLGLLRALHEALRTGPRGAAIGLCKIDLATGELRYAGVGNTRARTLSHSALELCSQDGTVGGNLPRLVEQRGRVASGDVVLLFTDGVSDRFDEEGLGQGGADALARKVVHRFGKSHDDAACVAVRCA